VIEIGVFQKIGVIKIDRVGNIDDFQYARAFIYGYSFFKGEKINPSVLVYYAEIEFIDGVVKTYKGDVTLKN